MNKHAVVNDCVQAAAAASAPAALTVEQHRDLNLAPQDRADLNVLIEQQPSVGVFVSRAWLSGFFAEPPDGAEPSLVIFRESGRLRGVLPIAIRRGLTHQQVSLLGGGFGSDRVDLIAARGFEAGCADTFLAWLDDMLGRRAFVLTLRDLPVESPLWGALHRINAERAWRMTVQPREVHTLPYLDLPEVWSSTIEERLHRQPRSIDKHRRWLERRGAVAMDLLKDAGEVADAFETLRALLHARWRNTSHGSVLDDPRLVRFHRRVLPLLLRDGRLRMFRLSVDGRPVAVYYGLAAGRWWGYCSVGYDREWAGRIHLGQLVLAAAVDRASQAGATEFDFLKGAERVKYLWPVRARATINADVYSAHAGSQFSRAAAATRDAAIGFARTARYLWPH